MDSLPGWVIVKLTMLEYVLEVVVANNQAGAPEDRSEQFKADMLARPMQLPPGSGPVDVDDLAAFQGLVRADLENFFRKVSSRETSVREVLAAE